MTKHSPPGPWSISTLVRSIYYAAVPAELQQAVLVRRRSAIWQRAGIIFIHIPKVAGTSINEALYGRFMGHVRAAEIERWGSGALRALPTFAVTRNPWDRLVSAYRFVRRGGGVGGFEGRVRHAERYQSSEFASFGSFVSQWLAQRELRSLDPAFHLQSDYVCDGDGQIIVDHIGKLEEMAPTYAFIADKLGRVPEIQRSNRSGAPVDYRSFYTSELAEQVGVIYAPDVRRFGYSFD